MRNNLSTINVYKNKNIKSEIVTQLIYGETFKILKKKRNWIKIKNPVIFEIIPKKQIKSYSFDKIEKDILKVLHKRISKIIEK